jgi:hypothetical protein
MELCFERGRENSMHPSYVRLQKSQCIRKERSKSRKRRLEKRRNNLMRPSLVRLKESKCVRRDSSKKQEEEVKKHQDC